MKNRAAIVGVGFAPTARDTGLTYKQLTFAAAKAAMDDAGMTPSDIDGVTLSAIGEPEVTGESVESAIGPMTLGQMLGMNPMNWFATAPTNFGDISMNAIAAVRAGFAHTVIAIHPCRTMPRRPAGSSGPRMQRGATLALGDQQFSAPYGPTTGCGLVMRRHMEVYGTTYEQFAMRSVTQRYHASLNEDALFRDPITVDDYLASRWISEPVRLLDCDFPCDTAGAVIFTTEVRASSWRKKPVFVEAAASMAVSSLMSGDYYPDVLTMSQKPCADAMWSRTDLGPADVDVAQIYDGFGIFVFTWLEALGFCKPGESGPFIAEGNVRLGGSLPINTDGGVCNVGRRHGASHCIEAVRQLRGECGVRQVPDAEVSMYTVAGSTPHCHAALLTAS